jgi:predicted MPP superfamily phosphohydrolase
MVLITGDLFDGSAPVDESILTPLNNLQAKSFFSLGNHEVYEGFDKVREAVKNLDIQLLENESVVLEGVQIIGVNDRQGLPKGKTFGSILKDISVRSDIPSVLMYHTPTDWEIAREQGVEVMLSGHTHNGQLFPFTLLVRLAFKYTNGVYEVDGNYLHVSPGTGTWGPPMRLGSRNQITLLHLVP